ncbi:MAG TPA: hypothetical protein VHO03_16480 [Ignavibacteriales bacterium]|nr:hypothetical protein [Ignavibacteriales bacterium]
MATEGTKKRRLRRGDRIAKIGPRLFTQVEAANYLRVKPEVFKKRFAKLIPVVVLDEFQMAPLWDVEDLDKFIDENKGMLPDDFREFNKKPDGRIRRN